jgi:hypothetical protein
MNENLNKITPRQAADISAEQVATVRETLGAIEEHIADRDALLIATEELRMNDPNSEHIEEAEDHIRHATSRLMDNQLFLGRTEDSIKNFAETYKNELHTAALAEAALDGVGINSPNAIN